jgi:hypothetical protein
MSWQVGCEFDLALQDVFSIVVRIFYDGVIDVE